MHVEFTISHLEKEDCVRTDQESSSIHRECVCARGTRILHGRRHE